MRAAVPLRFQVANPVDASYCTVIELPKLNPSTLHGAIPVPKLMTGLPPMVPKTPAAAGAAKTAWVAVAETTTNDLLIAAAPPVPELVAPEIVRMSPATGWNAPVQFATGTVN